MSTDPTPPPTTPREGQRTPITQPPPPPAPAPVDGVVQVYVNGVPCFTEYPMRLRCPYCRKNVLTNTYKRPGTFAYFLFFILMATGFWLCCCIPCCIDSCLDTVHDCPHCEKEIGYKPAL